MSRLTEFVGSVVAKPTDPALFNMYSDRCEYDLEGIDAPSVRTENLLSYLQSFATSPHTLIVAEAPGPWGCRFTGVPITSEVQLADPSFPISGQVCTVGEAKKEYSAGIFWRVLLPFFPGFVVWNSVPFHPFKPGQPDTIRTPSQSELKEYAPLTEQLIDIFSFDSVLALGRRAEKQLKHLGIDCTYIRHPSQGGATAFESGMLDHFRPDPKSTSE